jgi:hypothetical protein
MVLLITATGASLAAITTLYKSWRTQAPAFFYAGLMIFILSCVAWSYSQGWEFGLVYGLCLPALLVWPFIGASQTLLPAPKNSPQSRAIDTSVSTALRHTGHMLVVLPGLMLTSLLLSMAVSLRLPFAEAGQLATGIILLPLIWGGLAYHYLATVHKTKALFAYLVLSILSALMLIYLPGLE